MEMSSLHDGRIAMLQLTSWSVFVQCQNHMAHNALMWAIMDYCDRDVIRNCFVVVESLRHGFGQLVANISEWVRTRLAFEDWDMPCQSECWTVLGVEPQWVEKMEAMQLRWEGGKLKVTAALEDNDKVVKPVVAIFMHILKLRQLSFS